MGRPLARVLEKLRRDWITDLGLSRNDALTSRPPGGKAAAAILEGEAHGVQWRLDDSRRRPELQARGVRI